MRTVFAVFALTAIAAPSAAAQPRPAPARALAPAPAAAPAEAPPRVRRLTFEDDFIDAKRDLGDGDILTEPRKPRFPSLVRPRLDFIPELVKSADRF